MEDKAIEYSYDIPNGYIEIDPSHYEEVGLKGYVKKSTLNFFVKVENDNIVSSISVNRDSYIDDENSYDFLLELNLKNLKENGFEVVSIEEGTRKDGARLTKCHVSGRGVKLISMFSTIDNLFIGSSIIDDGKNNEKVIVEFMKNIRLK